MTAIEHMQAAILRSKAESKDAKGISTGELDDTQQTGPADHTQLEHHTDPLNHETVSDPPSS